MCCTGGGGVRRASGRRGRQKQGPRRAALSDPRGWRVAGWLLRHAHHACPLARRPKHPASERQATPPRRNHLKAPAATSHSPPPSLRDRARSTSTTVPRPLRCLIDNEFIYVNVFNAPRPKRRSGISAERQREQQRWAWCVTRAFASHTCRVSHTCARSRVSSAQGGRGAAPQWWCRGRRGQRDRNGGRDREQRQQQRRACRGT